MANVEFKYAPMFQVGKDDTAYRLLSKEGVSTADFEGHEIVKVAPEALTLLARQAFHDVEFMLRREHNLQVAAILNDPESSENDKYVALQFLRNAETAAKGILPFCQDTGTAIIHGEKGQQIWTGYEDETKRIVSVISRPWYNGCDLILKTANLLSRFTDVDFEWQVYGIPEMRFYEHKYGIKAEHVHIKVMGTASADELVKALCHSSCYVHSSYIDNSPNSICEAQILGVPVLATHVGGISSLVKDGESGVLFPANDPYTLASLIKQVSHDRNLAETLSKGARKQALLRHDPDRIK